MTLSRPLAALLALTASGPALAVGQLPDGVRPVSYDITVTPDAKALTFTGSETVIVQVEQPTRTLTLNANGLAIGGVRVDGNAARFTLNADLQQMTITLPQAATVGQHKVAITWSGTINQSPLGLFSIDYTNGDGSKARMLATQFEAPDARRFAPMWDEPAFKAKFTLSAVAPAGQTAFSNMPAANVETRPDGGKLYHFGETPVMSSYLLFLGIGDVDRKTVAQGKTEIGVITRKGVADRGDYALASAQRLLAYYNTYFGQPFPLPKLDMIAGPGSSQSFGAMENWGSIFYFEPEVLLDPQRSTQSNRERVFIVVAHEMAHQWFGDLVTMRWWDDLWLNEGFASWMENKTSSVLNPDWKSRASAVAFDREGALGIDATKATHPIVRHIETVDQINEAFDSITYNKGQAVIGMLEAYLGPDTFRAGIRRYMAKYKYSNTVTDQLWAELSAASGKPITDIAHDFTLQGGVPLISLTGVTCAGGTTTATLSQTRFGLDDASKQPLTWRVPVAVGALGGGSVDTIVRGAGGTTVKVRGCGPLVLNLGKQGYFRAQYAPAQHQKLVAGFARMTLEDRLGTMGDDLALAYGGYQPLALFFDDVRAVPVDADPLEWSAISGDLGEVRSLYDDTDLEQPFNARLIALLSPVLAHVGLDPKPAESPLTVTLREDLVSQLGRSGDPQIVAKARSYVAALRSNPSAIPAGIRDPILRTYARSATPDEWNALLALTRAEHDPVAKNEYVSLLGAARDEAVAKRALALLTGSEFTDPQKASILRAVASWHPDLAFDYAVANTATVNGFVEASTRSGYIPSLGSGSKDPAMPGKINAYAQKNLPAESRARVQRILDLMAVRKASAARLRPGVVEWLGQGAK